jgi:hypothetical protein
VLDTKQMNKNYFNCFLINLRTFGEQVSRKQRSCYRVTYHAKPCYLFISTLPTALLKVRINVYIFYPFSTYEDKFVKFFYMIRVFMTVVHEQNTNQVNRSDEKKVSDKSDLLNTTCSRRIPNQTISGYTFVVK